MPNFTDIKSYLGDWLGLDTTELPDSVRGVIVNITMRDILRNNELRFGETSDTFATIASPVTPDYAYPAGWSKPYSLWYTHPTTSKVVYLTYESSKAEFDKLFPDTTETDLPTHYTIWANKIRLGKSPDRVITINRNYYKILADLASASLTNAFTDEAWEVLFFNCFELASLYGIEDERIPAWVRKGKQMLETLVAEHARARSIGTRGQSREPG